MNEGFINLKKNSVYGNIPLKYHGIFVFREKWNLLLEQIENRDQKMYGAGEIHRFNRDVEEALTRIQEKYSSIPDEQGRDLFATQSYLKKHERFENELVALEAQVIVWYK